MRKLVSAVVSFVVVVLIVSSAMAQLSASAYYDVAMDSDDVDEQMRYLTKAIEADKNFVNAYIERGRIYYFLGKYELSLKDYDESIRVDPNCASCFFNRGRIHRKKGLYGLATADYYKAVELNPRDAEAHNALAWLKATCPDPQYRNAKEAVDLALMTVELERAGSYYDTLAAAYAEAGNFEKAVEAETEAYEISGKDCYKELIEIYKAKKTYLDWKKQREEEE